MKDTWYDKRETYRKFIEEYPDINNAKMEQRRFTNWLKIFARIKGWQFKQKKSGSDRTFILSSVPDIQSQGELI